MLSGEELLTIAEADTRQKENHIRDLVFGLLDCSGGMICFLPFFGQKINEGIQSVSLLSLTAIAPYLRIAYFTLVLGLVLWGVLTLALQNCQQAFWVRNKGKLSLAFHAMGVLLFIISMQPYAAVFLFILLAIKVLMLVKKQ